MLIELFIILALTLINGLFSMSEIAVVSSRRIRLQNQSQQGDIKAQQALDLMENTGSFLSTVQVGITLIGIFTGVYGGATIVEKLEIILRDLPYIGFYSSPIAYAGVVIFITFVTLILGELVPKQVGLRFPEKIAKLIVPFFIILSKIFHPVIVTLEEITKLILKLFPNSDNEPHVTEEEIKMIITQGSESGVIEETEEKIVSKVLRLGDRLVASVMSPRKDLVWINLDESIDKIWKIAVNSGHSYFPVCKGSVESIIGILAIKDIAISHASGDKEILKKNILEPITVPSSMTVLRVLETLKAQKLNIAIVIDEYGGVDGMVTSHDILEAIVGEFGQDKHGPEYTIRHDGTILVDASMDIDELFDLLELPHEEHEGQKGYHSVGGFVMGQLGHIPREGERFEYQNYNFEVIDMDRQRVDKVIITKK